MSNIAPAIGIDLGTTYSCVAVLLKGEVEVIKDINWNETTIPSHVYFPPKGYPIVGKTAKDKVHTDEEPKVFDAKRLIGRKFDDPEVKEDMKYWPFTVVRGRGNNAMVKVRNDNFRPEFISAHILLYLKKTAETRLNLLGQIKNAVITVPAYFNHGQRQATKDAGEIAGLNVLQIINEPTAAAIGYALDHGDEKERNVVVFDLGGGTFDVSVLNIKKGHIKVKAVGGDTHLGGVDFDKLLVEYCSRKFKTKNKTDLLAIKNKDEQNLVLHRLGDQCEQKKRVLSQDTKVNVSFFRIIASYDIDVDISRKVFEKLCEVHFQKCITVVETTLKDAGLDKSEIDEVVLAGGSVRIPKLRKMLSEYFGGKELRHTKSSDEVVVSGAAHLASLLNNPMTNKSPFVFTDVIAYSLGTDSIIDGVAGQMSTIIPKNSGIPCKRTRQYGTVYDNQTEITFRIHEGEDSIAKNNRLLGEFTLKGFLESPAGIENAMVTMELDLNGILTVTAVGVSLNNKDSITLDSHTCCMAKFEKEHLKLLLSKSEAAMDSAMEGRLKGGSADDESDNDSDVSC